ncbi:MAG: ArsR/SmtB family transcription factor [Leptospira bouyouniensis]|uniref:ArsR/SmtB family transcription factor n=1 Tax=Leptospira bouyouniensis TaxID=2484911 RepID=UPI001ABFE10C|nr:metalloregulator ArsR/SmtB family transcription factor [Leptospira bouyouniensis]
MTKYSESLNLVFQNLADPTRRAVLEKLSSGPATVSEMYASFEMALPSFMQHLSLLEKARLVKSYKFGRVRTFELEPNTLKIAETWLDKQRSMWEKRLDQLDSFLYKMKDKKNE